MSAPPAFVRARLLARDAHGVASVEYVIVLALVAVGASLALIALGVALLDRFHHQQALLLLPVP